MKLFPSILLLLVSISSSNVFCQVKNTADSAINYMVLRSGERIENINWKDWKYFYKKDKLKLNDRTIVMDSIAWYNNGIRFFVVLSNGLSATQMISGKINEYNESHIALRDQWGQNSVHAEYNDYVRKGNGPLTYMTTKVLKEMMADNPEAIEKLDALAKKVIKRLGTYEYLEIIKFYNAH